jgi:nucleoside-diphosphate-sugar epimerase
MIEKTRNVWVLGGTGYIGSALVKHLSGDQHNRLNLLVHKRGDRRFLDAFNTFYGSLSTIDERWFENYPPEVVFHLARPAGSNSLARFFRSYQGARANQRLVKIFSELPNPPMVVYVSGSLMYGKRAEPAHEETPLHPEAFARYYIRNEQPWLDAQKSGILDVRFARPGWIVGPGSWFVEFFWKPYLQPGKIPCYGDHPMSLIHLDDCAAMIDALSNYGQRGQNLNIFSGSVVSHKKFCQELAQILETDIQSLSFRETQKRYGKTLAQALTSSTPMNTMYPDIHNRAQLRFQSIKEMLTDVVRSLKKVHSR